MHAIYHPDIAALMLMILRLRRLAQVWQKSAGDSPTDGGVLLGCRLQETP